MNFYRRRPSVSSFDHFSCPVFLTHLYCPPPPYLIYTEVPKLGLPVPFTTTTIFRVTLSPKKSSGRDLLLLSKVSNQSGRRQDGGWF